ncbi:hypothetical protein EB796_017896 [Bugula neritina]|uniref:Uncharacterized protein n=1 Tax=Bugula neritina TaxID=10212 RepID=A0A7J7JDS3_BUGNE|nr:hypothetical protein EB796_017896 [Bugula neritina]
MFDNSRVYSPSHLRIILFLVLFNLGDILLSVKADAVSSSITSQVYSDSTGSSITNPIQVTVSGKEPQLASTVPSLGCLSNLDITPPCSTPGCHLSIQDYFANANESEPCLPGNHQIVETENTTYSVYNSLSGYSTVAVATNKWLLFRNSKDGSCDGVIFSNISQSICMQPGYCGSLYPWYLRYSQALPTEFGTESLAELCTTDVTTRNTSVCCREPLPVVIRSCNYYFVYKLLEKMPAATEGNICTAPSTELSALNIKYSIEDRQTIPKFLDELGKNESENLLTVGFGLHLLQRVQIRQLIQIFNKDLIKNLNAYSSRTRRRSVTVQRASANLSMNNIRTVIGSPVVVVGNETYTSKLYYTFYIHSDRDEIISRAVVRRAIIRIPNMLFTKLYAFISSADDKIPQNIVYPKREKETPQPTVLANVNVKATESTEKPFSWMIIIYIGVATGTVVILTLLGLAIYKLQLVKKQRRCQVSSSQESSELEGSQSDRSTCLKMSTETRESNAEDALIDEGSSNHEFPVSDGTTSIEKEKNQNIAEDENRFTSLLQKQNDLNKGALC